MLVWSYLKRLLTQRQCGLQRFARLGHATCIELQFRYALESSGLIFERLEEERGAFKSTVTGDDALFERLLSIVIPVLYNSDFTQPAQRFTFITLRPGCRRSNAPSFIIRGNTFFKCRGSIFITAYLKKECAQFCESHAFTVEFLIFTRRYHELLIVQFNSSFKIR